MTTLRGVVLAAIALMGLLIALGVIPEESLRISAGLCIVALALAHFIPATSPT